MKDPRGGKRPNSGRPKGTLSEENKKRAEMKRRWVDRIEKEADLFFDAQRDQALGHFKEVTTPDGKIRVYKKSPNSFALEWIFEHIWGKAPQKIDLDAEIHGDLVITDETAAALKAAISHAIPTSNYEGNDDEPADEPEEPQRSDEDLESDIEGSELPKGIDLS